MKAYHYRLYTRAEDKEIVQFIRDRNFKSTHGERIYRDLAAKGVVVRSFQRSYKSLKNRFETLVKNRTDLMTNQELSLFQKRNGNERSQRTYPKLNFNPVTKTSVVHNKIFAQDKLLNDVGCAVAAKHGNEIFDQEFEKDLEKETTNMHGLSRKVQRKSCEQTPQQVSASEESNVDLTSSPENKRLKMDNACLNSPAKGNQTVVKTESEEDAGKSTRGEDDSKETSKNRMEDPSINQSPVATTSATTSASASPSASQVEANDCVNSDKKATVTDSPSPQSSTKLGVIDEPTTTDKTDNESTYTEGGQAGEIEDGDPVAAITKYTATKRIQLMNAEPTKENRERALKICGAIIQKVFLAEASPLDKYKVVTECVYFNILNHTQSLKLLCKKFDMKFVLNKHGNERCKEIVESIVGYWDDERLELRDLARSCMGVLLLANELLHPTMLTQGLIK